MSGDEPMPRPDLHGLRVDAEQARGFVQREHALLAQPLVARAEPVVASDPFDDPGVKRAAGARAIALRIQQASDLPLLCENSAELATGGEALRPGTRRPPWNGATIPVPGQA
jgi:hypothetical protein